MNTWLVHIHVRPTIRLAVEVDADSRNEAEHGARLAARLLGVPGHWPAVTVKEIIA